MEVVGVGDAGLGVGRTAGDRWNSIAAQTESARAGKDGGGAVTVLELPVVGAASAPLPLTPHRRGFGIFLGLGALYFAVGYLLTMRYNQTLGTKGDLSAKEEAELVAAYEPEVALLVELVPDIDLSLWPRFSHLGRP